MDRGGAESWLMSLLRNIDRDAMAMDFCVLSGQGGIFASEIESLGAKIIPCRLKPIALFKKRFAEILYQNKYDVVHSHVWNFSGVILKIAYKCNIPVRIAHSHTTQSGYPDTTLYRHLYNWWTRKLIFRYATHCLACASEAAEALFGPDWQDIDKCQVLYCSVELDAFSPEQDKLVDKEALGLPPNAVVIGNVGNLRRAKNHAFFLDIAAELVKIRPDAYFFIAGEGDLRSQLEAKAKSLAIENRVIFAGMRDDVPELLMNVFDVLLFPSLYEGMPITLVEAAAAGLPVVCSDCITTEATNIIPELFTRLSLKSSAEVWAKAVDKSLTKGRIPHEKAYNIIKNSHFSVDYCLKELGKIYGCKKTAYPIELLGE
jgi:glycosyltransferase involved in cell wall biosynthesis